MAARPPAYLTLGIDVRERFEHFSAFEWGGVPSSPEGYLLQRVMPHADLHFGAHVQVRLCSWLSDRSPAAPIDSD